MFVILVSATVTFSAERRAVTARNEGIRICIGWRLAAKTDPKSPKMKKPFFVI